MQIRRSASRTLLPLALLSLLGACTENVVNVERRAAYMVLDETVTPGYAWPGTLVTVRGRNIAAEGATFRASVGSLEAEVVSVTESRIVVRIPHGATVGGLRIERTLTGESISTGVAFHLVQSPYVVNAWSIETGGLGAVAVWTVYGSDGMTFVDTAIVGLRPFRPRAGERSSTAPVCADVPGGDTVVVCRHDISGYVSSDDGSYGYVDQASSLTAIVDAARGVIARLRIVAHAWDNRQSGAHGVQAEREGITLELRDVPFSRTSDGALHIALTAAQIRAGLIAFRQSRSQQFSEDAGWVQTTEESRELHIADTASLTIRMYYEE